MDLVRRRRIPDRRSGAVVGALAGIMNLSHHVFVSQGAIEIGSPADNFESTKIAWVPIADVPKLIAEQQIVNYAAMASLLLVFANSEHR
ncbi:MAG TPA: hypothetical protein VGH27_22430 [Streptosporangiaceae bacterium]|jgi:hypothetical protein